MNPNTQVQFLNGWFAFLTQSSSHILDFKPISDIQLAKTLSYSVGPPLYLTDCFLSCEEAFSFYEVPLVSCWPQFLGKYTKDSFQKH